MTQANKLLQKFLQNPSSLKYQQIERVLLHLNFTKVRAKGSHVKFKHLHLKYDLIIPVHNNDCKNFYKDLAAKTISKIS